MSKMQHRRCIHQSSATASESNTNLSKHQSRSSNRKGTSLGGLAKLSLLLLTLFSVNSVAHAEEKKFNKSKAG